MIDESSELSPDGISVLSSTFDTSKKNAVINVNESIISLLLKLHSKYSGRRDSYVPIFQRKGMSAEKEYRYTQSCLQLVGRAKTADQPKKGRGGVVMDCRH